MEPTIRPWVFMRGPEGLPLWVRADGSTIRTSPYKVELLHAGDNQPDQALSTLRRKHVWLR
eukprot:1329504-Prorocentrum_lima.AAC.1